MSELHPAAVEIMRIIDEHKTQAGRIRELQAEVERWKGIAESRTERGRVYNHAWKDSEAKLRAVGKLPGKWRDAYKGVGPRAANRDAANKCADELEALLK